MALSLAPYAVQVDHSRGRRHPEPPHPYRNDFQRDRDRVIHSRAFRRLEAKTQVFTGRYSDHFRNRLTHTIEVAQISRTIATQLALNVDLVEALALAHDIGHPPFGHAGEKALDAAMRQHGLFFDHNLHALRIVEDFEQRYAAFRGLNLTFEMREGIIKHSRDYNPAEFPELAEYWLDKLPPLEAQLIDATDELAYNTADLDDGYEARLLTLEQIRESVPVFAGFFDEVKKLYPVAPKKLQFNEVLRRILDRWVSDLIQNTQAQLDLLADSDPRTVRDRRGKAGEDARRSIATLDEIRAFPRRLVGLSSQIEEERAQTKDFLYRNLYYSPALQPEKEDAERVITELFDLWMKQPEKLPASYQEKAESEPRARVVCDYIAGMTDTYIYEQYEKYCGRKASV
ncbi:MAG: Deoxyguanosinetriphosphate triphosphohydrolase [Acidobacteriaceae bacterium]|nr:Deoxyguanosinetriphosphate triphosphohydrolase [Acidobacteriaceae bacterium]